MERVTWQVIEDNGGGLHLAVFEGDQVIFYGNGYEYNPGCIRENTKALYDGGHPLHDRWESDADDPQAAYERLTSHDSGWQIVADQDRLYWDRMGVAAEKEFIISWRDLVLIDYNTAEERPVEGEELIRYLREFRETGGIAGLVYFERLGLPHEDPDEFWTWGPESPEYVDWTGFPKDI